MKVHFMGIAGSGASAAAAIAQAQGFEVTGCDKEITDEFTKPFSKDQLFSGHSPNHLSHPRGATEILAITPAITSFDPNNPELVVAKDKGIEVLTWQHFLGKYLTKDEQSSSTSKIVIAVCGTHGKSTTTAMIGLMLEEAGLDPTVVLGAIVPRWGTNYRIPSRHSERSEESQNSKPRDLSLIARNDKKEIFVIEADEFNDNFLPTIPDISVVTSIEMDHPEYFKDFESYKESFKKFLSQTKQTIIANLSDPVVAKLLASHPRGVNTIIDYSKKPINFNLKVPGQYNKLNAQAVFQVGLLLGIPPATIRQTLQNFTGIGRRFEYLGKFKGADVYSDFGHHPTEIKVTMEAAREKFPNKKIWLIYEPHMFTRTKALFDDFVKVFKSLPVDQIIITDIYPSREVDSGLVTSQQLVETIHSNTHVYHSKDQLEEKLKSGVQVGDVVFFMGAGPIDFLARKLVK